jgi:hypothetical protein
LFLLPERHSGTVEKGIHISVRSLVEAVNLALLIGPDSLPTLYFLIPFSVLKVQYNHDPYSGRDA